MRYLDLKLAYRMDDIKNIEDFPFPKSLTIYPSEVCNLDCPGCNSKFIHQKNGFMEYHLYEDIIKDFTGCGGRAVAFEGGGEPMLHPNIGAMIKFAKDNLLKVGIITNGTIYYPEMLLADWVRVSIPNSNSIPEIVEDNIKRLMKERTSTVIGIKLLRSKTSPVPTTSILSDYVQTKNLRNHANSLIENPVYVQPCGLTPLRAVVDYDGTFYPCPFFYAQEGTAIGKGVLSEIWGSKAHQDAIENIVNCNEYDCPMLDIDWSELRKADLDFL